MPELKTAPVDRHPGCPDVKIKGNGHIGEKKNAKAEQERDR